MRGLKSLLGFLAVTFIAFFAFADTAMANDREQYKCSESPAEAIRKNYFLCNAKVTPDRFEWMGHQIKVRNAWIEKSIMGEANLCFDFYADDLPESFDDETKTLNLQCYPDRSFKEHDFSESRTLDGGSTHKIHRIRRPAIDGQKVGALCQVKVKKPKTSTDEILGPILELESEIPLTTWPSDDLGEPEV